MEVTDIYNPQLVFGPYAVMYSAKGMAWLSEKVQANLEFQTRYGTVEGTITVGSWKEIDEVNGLRIRQSGDVQFTPESGGEMLYGLFPTSTVII
jgi:hypothetical protein